VEAKLKEAKQGSSHEYTVTAARMIHKLIKLGISLNKVPQVCEQVVDGMCGVSLASINIKFSRKTCKLLYLGIAKLDEQALAEALRAAPYILVAGDESKRFGAKLFPICVQFWHKESQRPWFGLFKVSEMPDKTGETMAKLFFTAITEGMGVEPHKVLYCLSDNTSSITSEEKGAVKLLYDMLERRAEEEKAHREQFVSEQCEDADNRPTEEEEGGRS
jgi:hypothetical protein